MAALELWGGIECTINRVDNRWRSQLQQSGHLQREQDLDLIAALGIQTLRYPVLWEHCAVADRRSAPWQWAADRLRRLRTLGVAPIVGLIHHGSGPAHTSLLHESFAPGLAAHARLTAELFPWVEQYTPVNEPLTTARFSGLYGHWYPHGRDNRSFARALINQCRAIVLSMRAIRAVNSDARLVQTEDLGTTYGTPEMRDQVEFDNHRRWLTWDLLCGRVTMHHPLRDFLLLSGISSEELSWFADHPCPPQVIGVNHYVTSDRFLDRDVHRYPSHTRGSNGRDCYADVDGVRKMRGRYRGWDILEEAALRYSLPIALTEVHLGCSREEQLRWLEDAWNACAEIRARGHDIRALTAWALFGSFDWESLLTRSSGQYEVGAFDVRAPTPRPTAIAHRIRELAHHLPGGGHPVLSADGWWQTGAKFSYGTPFGDESRRETVGSLGRPHINRQPLVICGTGTLGRALALECERRGLIFEILGRAELDICDSAKLDAMLSALNPWGLVNATGYVRVDEAETHVSQCFRENSDGPRTLAEVLGRRAIPLVSFSTDLVFDGSKRVPYVESDIVNPLNVYGRSKAAGEAAILKHHPSALCIRTAAFFGYWERSDYLAHALDMLDAGQPVRAPSDVLVSPTFVPELASVTLDLFIDRTAGLWHLANSGALSWADLVRQAATLASVETTRLEAHRESEAPPRALRPRNSALSSERGWVMRSLDDALYRFAETARDTFLPQRRELRGRRMRVA